jgi:hypothetical protein
MRVGGQRHAQATLPPRKTRYPVYRRLAGPQSRSGRVRKNSPSPGFDSRTVQPVASRSTDYGIPVHDVAVCSLCNSLYPAGQAATVMVPKVTESIKSGVYGFGNTKNRQQPFIRPSGFSHTDKHGCEWNTYTA